MVNEDKIEKFYDIIDESCNILYDKLKMNYLKGLFASCENILTHRINQNLDLETINYLKDLYAYLDDNEFLKEEIRKATQYLFIKTFKEMNYQNVITPDSISFLMVYLMEIIFKQKAIKVIDPLIGSGNLILAIANHYEKISIYGIDNDEVMISLAKLNADLIDTSLNLFLQDTFTSNLTDFDLIVSDLGDVDLSKFINYHLKTINDEGYMFLIVDKNAINDIDKNNLLGVIDLPNSFLKEKAKCLLIIKKGLTKQKFLLAIMPNEKNEMLKFMAKLKDWFSGEEKIIKIMSVNAGSSSLKFQLLLMPSEVVVASGIVEKIGQKNSIYTIKYNGNKKEIIHDIADHQQAVDFVLHDLLELKIIKNFDEIKGVGHRIVQGGEFFKESVIINDEYLGKIAELSDLAPLHNPSAVVGIKAFMHALPNVYHVAVFDTTFHQTMKKDAYMYAVPYEWYEKYRVRRYGAHGTSHRYVSLRTAELLGKKPEDVNVVVCHIGNGASICAVKHGKSVDTSMGLTPLGGIPMGTRSGDIDPAILNYIADKEGLNVKKLVEILNKKSGYLGVSGIGSDARDLTKGMEEGNERCRIAFDVQSKRIVDFIASYYVYMGGLDAIAFTAGVGENVIHLRKNIVDRLGCLGIKLDEEANNVRAVERMISTEDSKIKVFIVPTNEEVMIARDTMNIAHIK